MAIHDTHEQYQRERSLFVDGVALIYGATQLESVEIYVNAIKKGMERKVFAQLMELNA